MRADPDLYRRGIATLLASWEEYARAAAGAAVLRLPGVTAAVFPEGPERDVYNNAVLDRGLAPAALADAVGAMEAAYSAAGIDRFAAWVHETEAATAAKLERRSYTLAETTRAMGMDLESIRVPRAARRRPAIGLGGVPPRGQALAGPPGERRSGCVPRDRRAARRREHCGRHRA